jgi:hypothetical protein
MIPVFELAKTFHTLDRAATVTVDYGNERLKRPEVVSIVRQCSVLKKFHCHHNPFSAKME